MGQIASIKAARKTGSPVAGEPLEKALAAARLNLIETGTRSRLVNTPRGTRRTRSLSLMSASPDSVFASLVRGKKSLRIAAAEEKTEGRDVVRLKSARTSPPRPVFPSANLVQTTLSAGVLQKCLQTIEHDARTAEEERGVNILFLAIGFLRWFEDENSDVARHAPLVLIPVNLLRDSKRGVFELKFREDDIGTNKALQERLRHDFGIALPAVPEFDDWLPRDYFADVVNAVALKPRWSVDFDGLELGFYSFSKMLMVRDLDPANWPKNALLAHPLLRGLLCEGFAEAPPSLSEDVNLDQILNPGDLVHVVDADSSQTRVIETVAAGRNLVVQGPPGTGKSQTIANIIADAVDAGKSVLFVAEKMAALNVVHERLRKSGLAEICLELHSHTANKRHVAESLSRTLQASVESDGPDDGAVRQLTDARDRLNFVAARLHAPIGETGLTPYQALAVQIAAANDGFAPAIKIVEEAGTWTKADYEERDRLAGRLAELTASAGPCKEHVYFGVGALGLQPADFRRLVPGLRALAEKAEAAAKATSRIANCLGCRRAPTIAALETYIKIFQLIGTLPQGGDAVAAAIAMAPSLRRIAKAAAAGAKWRKHQGPYLRTFHPAAWTANVAPLREPIAKGATFAPTRLGRGYREACRTLASLLAVPLPQPPAERLALVDALLKGQTLSRELVAEARFLSDLLGDAWRGKGTDFVLVHSVARTIEELRALEPNLDFGRVTLIAREGGAAAFADQLAIELGELLAALSDAINVLDLDVAAVFQTDHVEGVDLDVLAGRAALWAASQDRFEDWVRLATADRRLRAAGPAALADAIEAGQLDPGRARMELKAAFAEACWKRAIAADPDLAAFDGGQHGALIGRFAALESARRAAAARSIRRKHKAAIPRGAMGAMGVIRDEIGRKRNHMPLRKLMRAAGDAIQKIKPVFLMSPLSVAEYLPPGAVEFDLLVIDEASQIRPVDALGVVARCRQIVVVGDKKQLPPTSFFDRVVNDEGDPLDDDARSFHAVGAAPVADLESILTLCEARGLESRMLRWHYRSRHPSLIEVSNAEFYGRLVMPPAPAKERKTRGLVVRHVCGAYDRGGLRTNVVEADAIAEALCEHARAAPQLSLGVIAFSTAQRNLIADRLEAKRRADPMLDAFLREAGHESVFVKNLENVQGDERDVILISIGYGPREAGKPLDSMAFGPISTEGGERRLNVLFTRARARCEVFVSFGSGDINLERATGEGPRVLKRFLHFAETGVLEDSAPTGVDFDSPFEAAVAAAIEDLGYRVDAQVGSAGFRIDLAVRDPAEPGRYMLAVECDGATYHSAVWARERDRLRQEVLEGLGWRVYRVWSTDWFYRRGEQIAKLKAALKAARSQRDQPA